MRCALALLAFTLAACDREPPPSASGVATESVASNKSAPTNTTLTSGAPADASSGVPSQTELAARWACAADGDCWMSCRFGAVNKTFVPKHECKDGCAQHGPTKCVKGECTTLLADGGPDPSCNHQAIPNE